MFKSRKENNRKEGERIRRGDVCLMAFCMLLALGSFVWSAVSRKDGQVLRISCNGQTLVNMPLSQISRQKRADGAARYCLVAYGDGDASCEWHEESPDVAAAVPEGNSYNLLAVSGEYVWMEAADCRDQICVHHIPISDGGESMICLPHKLVVEIVGEADVETPDGMAKTGKMEWRRP